MPCSHQILIGCLNQADISELYDRIYLESFDKHDDNNCQIHPFGSKLIVNILRRSMLAHEYYFILLSCLLPFCTSLSIPINSACEVSQIEVGTATFSTVDTYNNISITEIYESFPITFMTAQLSADYKASVLFSSINYDLVSSTYDIQTWMESTQQIGMSVYLYAAPGSRVSNIEFRYIVIPAAVQQIHLRQITYVSGGVYLAPQQSFAFDAAGIPSFALDSSCEAVGLYRGAQIIFTLGLLKGIGLSIEIILTSTSSLSAVITNIGGEAITVTQLYATAVWYSRSEVVAQIKTFEVIKGQLDMSATALQSNETILDNCFFALSAFASIYPDLFRIDLAITSTALSNRNYFNYSDFTVPYLIFSTTRRHAACCFKAKYYDISGLCFDSCPDSYYNTVLFTCAKCSALDCLSCSSATLCTRCGLGKLVGGHCTQVRGCSHVNPSLTSLANNCAQCSEGYVWSSATNSCSCAPGLHEVTGLCTDIAGCVLAELFGDQIRCRFCDPNRNFQLVDGSCRCVQGFSLSESTVSCEEVCGDGTIFAHACDDGNLVSGDGCSAECTIEDRYYCYNGSESHASNCVYSRFDIRLAVVSVRKTAGLNQGRFEFAFTPALALFDFRRVVANFSFSSTPNASSVEWSELNGRIVALVTYDQDVEGGTAFASAELNRSILIQASLSTTFSMVSQDLKLVVFRAAAKRDLLKAVLQMLSLVALGVFVVASLVHRMIGVELLHAFQVVYFVGALLPSKTEPSLALADLANFSLNLKYSANSCRNYYCGECYEAFSEENLVASRAVLLLVIGIPAILVVLWWVHGKSSISSINARIETLCSNFYSAVLFPFAVGFLFIGAMAVSAPSGRIAAAVSLSLTIIVSFTFFSEWRLWLAGSALSQDRSLLSKSYVPRYLTFAFAFFAVVLAANYGLFSQPFHASLLVLVPFFVWFVCTLPYEHAFHNFAQICNLLLAVSFVAWSAVREASVSMLEEENELFYLFLLVFLMGLALVLTTIRVFVEARRRWLSHAGKNARKHQKAQDSRQKLDQTLPRMTNINVIKDLEKLNHLIPKPLLLNQEGFSWESFTKKRLGITNRENRSKKRKNSDNDQLRNFKKILRQNFEVPYGNSNISD